MSLNQRQKTRVFLFYSKNKPRQVKETHGFLMIIPFHFKKNNIIIFKIYFDM
jgi:hypothetical protein